SDELGMLAHPCETIAVKNTSATVERITKIAQEKNVAVIVVGLPRNMNGSFGPAAEKTRAFVEELRKATIARVITWDERLSSVAAQKSLHAAGRKTKDSRAIID